MSRAQHLMSLSRNLTTTAALNGAPPVLPGEGALRVCGPGDGVDDLLAVVEVARRLQQDRRRRAPRGGRARHRGRVHVDEGVGAARLGVPGRDEIDIRYLD